MSYIYNSNVLIYDLTKVVSLLRHNMLCHWWHLNICHIYIKTFPKHENPLFFFHYCVGHGADIEFHIKSGAGGGPRFRDNDALSWHQKNLFSTL